MKKVLIALFIVLWFFTGSSYAEVIYSEDFSTDPNYNLIVDRPGYDVLEWDSATQSYRIYFPSDGHAIDAYAKSPSFQTIEDSSFEIMFDLKTDIMTFGQHMSTFFSTEKPGWKEGLPPVGIGVYSNWMSNYTIADHNGYAEYTPGAAKNIWYRWSIKHDEVSDTADISVINRETCEILFERSGIDFNPAAFDSVYLGHTMFNSEGGAAEMFFDNFLVTTPIDDSLLAHYPFNGNFDDATGNGHQGIPFGDPSFIEDRFSCPESAVDFDGTNDFIEIQDDGTLSGMDQLSISCWVRIAELTDYHIMVCKVHDGDGTYATDSFLTRLDYVNGETMVTFSLFKDTRSNIEYPTDLTLGEWHNLTFTWDGNTMRLYIDSVEVDTAPFIKSSINANHSIPLTIGKAGGSYPNWFDGAIDDVRLYNRALSHTEVIRLSSICPPQPCEPLNNPPVADAGLDKPDEVVGDDCMADVPLDGSGSYDPDDDPLSYTWIGFFGAVSGVNPTVELGLGIHPITLTVSDGYLSDTDEVLITVVDRSAPVPDLSPLPTATGQCSATISSAPTATDNCAGTVVGTTSDPLTYSEQGTYTVNWSYDDVNGNTSSGSATVTVVDT
ncbi:LamG-like jellyroll fold domain-containing protein, partial [Thermodesulfobacteriota bacterium]